MEKLPFWLAPNIITLTGFSFNVTAVIMLVACFGLETEGPVDSWYGIWLGFSYFFYTTFDNCDGKQARRTRSGSPLGMLVDHGCDATSSTILPFIFSRLVQVGTGLPALLVCMVPTIPFYYLIYQEYYTGVLNLPFLSGPDDTSLLVTAICWFTALVGSQEYWGSTVELPYELGQARVGHVGVCVVFTFETLSVLYSVLRAIWLARKTAHF